jgi:hypothetical protein
MLAFVMCLNVIYYIYTFQDGSFVSLQHKFEPDFIPTYAVIDKKPPPSPSSLKNGRTSGTFPKKHVTMVTNPDYRAKDRTIPMEYHVIKPSPPPYGYPSLQYNTQNGYRLLVNNCIRRNEIWLKFML